MKICNQLYVQQNDNTRVKPMMPYLPPVKDKVDDKVMYGPDYRKDMNDLDRAISITKSQVEPVITKPGNSPYTYGQGKKMMDQVDYLEDKKRQADYDKGSMAGNPLFWLMAAPPTAVDGVTNAVTGGTGGFAGLLNNGSGFDKALYNSGLGELLNPGNYVTPFGVLKGLGNVGNTNRSLISRLFGNKKKPTGYKVTDPYFGRNNIIINYDTDTEGMYLRNRFLNALGDDFVNGTHYEPLSIYGGRARKTSGFPWNTNYMGELNADSKILAPAANYVKFLQSVTPEGMIENPNFNVSLIYDPNGMTRVAGAHYSGIADGSNEITFNPRHFDSTRQPDLSKSAASTGVHEVAGHGTEEPLFENVGMYPNYVGVWNDIANFPSFDKFVKKNNRPAASVHPGEVRSTGLEGRVDLLDEDGTDVTTYDWRKWFGSDADRILGEYDNQNLMNGLSNINSYGRAYSDFYDYLGKKNPSLQQQYGDLWRKGLAIGYEKAPESTSINAWKHPFPFDNLSSNIQKFHSSELSDVSKHSSIIDNFYKRYPSLEKYRKEARRFKIPFGWNDFIDANYYGEIPLSHLGKSMADELVYRSKRFGLDTDNGWNYYHNPNNEGFANTYPGGVSRMYNDLKNSKSELILPNNNIGGVAGLFSNGKSYLVMNPSRVKPLKYSQMHENIMHGGENNELVTHTKIPQLQGRTMKEVYNSIANPEDIFGKGYDNGLGLDFNSHNWFEARAAIGECVARIKEEIAHNNNSSPSSMFATNEGTRLTDEFVDKNLSSTESLCDFLESLDNQYLKDYAKILRNVGDNSQKIHYANRIRNMIKYGFSVLPAMYGVSQYGDAEVKRNGGLIKRRKI